MTKGQLSCRDIWDIEVSLEDRFYCSSPVPSYDAISHLWPSLFSGHVTLYEGFYCTCISFIYREPDIKTEQLDTSGEQMTSFDDICNKYIKTEQPDTSGEETTSVDDICDIYIKTEQLDTSGEQMTSFDDICNKYIKTEQPDTSGEETTSVDDICDIYIKTEQPDTAGEQMTLC